MVSKITTIVDVKLFAQHLVNDLYPNFHPDDDFACYRNYDTKQTTFSAVEAALYNALMNECALMFVKRKVLTFTKSWGSTYNLPLMLKYKFPLQASACKGNFYVESYHQGSYAAVLHYKAYSNSYRFLNFLNACKSHTLKQLILYCANHTVIFYYDATALGSNYAVNEQNLMLSKSGYASAKHSNLFDALHSACTDFPLGGRPRV